MNPSDESAKESVEGQRQSPVETLDGAGLTQLPEADEEEDTDELLAYVDVDQEEIPTVGEATESLQQAENKVSTVARQRAQLDLAHAYLSMGDKEEARSLLKHLIDSEDRQIREEAEQRLANL